MSERQMQFPEKMRELWKYFPEKMSESIILKQKPRF